MDDTRSNLHRQLADGLALLPDKPEESVDSTLRALWFAAAGDHRSAALAMHGELPELTDHTSRQRLHDLVSRRLAGEPLAHITGRQRFMQLEMLSGPQALIPRAETELLVHAAIDLLCSDGAPCCPRLLDVCCGSGNIAFALARQLEHAVVHASDLCPEAISLARLNGRHLGLHSRVLFHQGDLLAPVAKQEYMASFDLLICAPPYIGTAKVALMADEIAGHEPRLAFDGGPFGVSILLRLIEDAPAMLKQGGWLALEVGLGQGPALVSRLHRNAAYDDVRALADPTGATRVVLARRS